MMFIKVQTPSLEMIMSTCYLDGGMWKKQDIVTNFPSHNLVIEIMWKCYFMGSYFLHVNVVCLKHVWCKYNKMIYVHVYIYIQIWLDLVMDNCHSLYITKMRKRKKKKLPYKDI
jgi:uncharacterized metal-binding protein